MYMNDGNKTKINLRNKSVFITGVAGFIGSNLAKRLLSTVEGVKVVGLDNMNHYYDVRLKEARLNELEQFDNFSFVKGNLADKAVIESIFEQYKPEIVVNLGAQAGVRYSITNPDAYVEANLIGFYNILEACRHSYDEGHTGCRKSITHRLNIKKGEVAHVNKLGFAIVRENFRKERNDWKLDLRVGEGADAIELEIFAEPNPPKRVNRPEACGLRHLAFRVEDVEATVAELEQMGIGCEPIRLDSYTQKKMTFFFDPDGLPLELHE